MAEEQTVPNHCRPCRDGDHRSCKSYRCACGHLSQNGYGPGPTTDIFYVKRGGERQ